MKTQNGQYFVSTSYDAELLKKTAHVQGNTRTLHNLIYAVICVALIVWGLQYGDNSMKGLPLVALGCILLPLSNYSLRRKARDAGEELGGKRVSVRYEFQPDQINLSSDKLHHTVKYEEVSALREDDDAFYLFYSRTGSIYIAKSSLKKDQDGFRKFVEEKTKRKFKKSVSLLTFNIRDLIGMFRR